MKKIINIIYNVIKIFMNKYNYKKNKRKRKHNYKFILPLYSIPEWFYFFLRITSIDEYILFNNSILFFSKISYWVFIYSVSFNILCNLPTKAILYIAFNWFFLISSFICPLGETLNSDYYRLHLVSKALEELDFLITIFDFSNDYKSKTYFLFINKVFFFWNPGLSKNPFFYLSLKNEGNFNL